MTLRRNYYGDENLSEKANFWLDRAEKMAARRQYFEEMWRRSLFAFVAHVVYEGGDKRQFDPDVAPELQAYYSSKLSALGFRFTDIRYPLEFAVVMRKMAQEYKNVPQPDWMVLGEDDQSPALLFKHVYKGITTQDANADYELFEGLLGKNVFGSAFFWSRMVEYTSHTQEPKDKNEAGQWIYEKKENKVVKFKTSNVDLRHVLIDEGCTQSSLEDCEDAIVFEYYSEAKGPKVFSDIDFKTNNIHAKNRNEVFQDLNDKMGGDQKPVFEVMHCYHKTEDEYTILINGKEYRTSPIPMMSFRGEKEIPLAMLVDHKIPGQPYGYGEPAIVKAFREIKNKNRNMIYDITKKGAKPTLAIDPLSSFDEEKYMWGQDFIRVAPSDLQPIPIQMNLDPALTLDDKTDQDVITVTGVNITDTANPPSDETATKTVVRKESQVAIVDLGLTFNTISGLQRWHRINANIILVNLKVPDLDGEEEREVMVEGTKLFRSQIEKNDKFLEQKEDGRFTFKFKGEDVDYTFIPTLKMGNIAVSDQLEKAMTQEGLEVMFKIAPDVYNQEIAGGVIRDMYNLPKGIINKQETGMPGVTGNTEEDEIDQLIKQAGGVLPEEKNISLDYKNAKQNQVLAQGQADAEAMGAPGAPVSLPTPVAV